MYTRNHKMTKLIGHTSIIIRYWNNSMRVYYMTHKLCLKSIRTFWWLMVMVNPSGDPDWIFWEDQRLDNDGNVRAAALQTVESTKNDGEDICRFIDLIGKGGVGKSHALDEIITTMLQRHGWSMSNIMVSDTSDKAASIINAFTIFHLNMDWV